jgi:hypothetical protein
LFALAQIVLGGFRARRGVGVEALVGDGFHAAQENIQCLPSSFAAIFSMVDLVPKGVPQEMQWKGSSAFTVIGGALKAGKFRRGSSVITFSGQVAAHRPHCTQASSRNFKVGRSGSSVSALVGQAETQERQSVQPATSTTTAPKGAPFGRGTMSTGAGAARCSSRMARLSTPRFWPSGAKLAGFGDTVVAGLKRKAATSASGSSVSMVAAPPWP